MITNRQTNIINYLVICVNDFAEEVFNKLSDTETGLYRESPAYVATLLKDEIANGKLVQMEV